MKNKKKTAVAIQFSESNKAIYIELNDSQSPRTVRPLLDILPIKVKTNR